jgi:hypothetical protein
MRINRPISADLYPGWSFRASEAILVSRLASRSRRNRSDPWGSVRRNISKTCWVALRESSNVVRFGWSTETGSCGAAHGLKRRLSPGLPGSRLRFDRQLSRVV